MSKEKKSIYQLIREELGHSRQHAADKIAEVEGGRYINIDENRLVKLEHGTAKLQPEDVVALSKAIRKPKLFSIPPGSRSIVSSRTSPYIRKRKTTAE